MTAQESLPTPRVSVIVPNFNGVEHLPECMASLAEQTYTDFETIVIDNASSDQSVAWLEGNRPEVRVVRRADNGGFSAAVNAGIAATSSEYVALLNNDTAADRRWLEALVDALDTTRYDFAASLMVFYESPETVNAAGDYFDMSILWGRQRGRGLHVDGFRDRVRVLGACAGAAIYRRGFFDDVGLFDEDFFLINEDTDLNLRALVAGKRCLYVPTAVVRHKDSATIKQQPSSRMARLDLRNGWFVLGKNMPWVLLPYVALTWVWHSFTRVFSYRRSRWKGTVDRLREAPARASVQCEGFSLGYRKRGDTWSRRQLALTDIVRWLFEGVGPA